MTFEEIKNRLIRIKEISIKMEAEGINKDFIKEVIEESKLSASYPASYFMFELLVQWETEMVQHKKDNLIIAMRIMLNQNNKGYKLVGPPYKVAFNESDFGLDTPDFISAKPE